MARASLRFKISFTQGLLFFCTISPLSNLFAWSPYKKPVGIEASTCGKTPYPLYLTARHIEGKGIGYKQGYTTLEGFFASLDETFVPFLDLRGHIFNNGRPAANLGLGARYLATSRIFGINCYYDYRETKHQSYNQISFGLESLGEIIDLRANGYIPLGRTKSSLYSPSFKAFQGNTMYISMKRECALGGFDLELGAHLDTFPKIPLYFALGPYYFTGHGKNAWGGEGRITASFYDYVKIAGNVSYDTLFKWIGQGEVGITISFGRRKTLTEGQNSCKSTRALARRLLQPVDYKEIIVLDTKHETLTAINPTTQNPYVFWFVDNTSNSLGTIESPFPTLLQAQNASSSYDIIYVFPGDGSSTGMDNGIFLKDNQMLLGSATDHTIATTAGNVTIPTFTTTMPLFTNSLSLTPCVTLANNNTVSGLYCHFTSLAIAGQAINNTSISYNTYTATPSQPQPNNVAISLQESQGTLEMFNNTFSTEDIPGSIGILAQNSTVKADVIVANSSFLNHASGCVVLQNTGTSSGTLTVNCNTFTAPIGLVYSQGVIGGVSSSLKATVSQNSFTNFEQESIIFFSGATGSLETTILGNNVAPGSLLPADDNDHGGSAIICFCSEDSRLISTIQNNLVTGAKQFGIAFVNASTQNVLGYISNNLVENCGLNPGNTLFGGGIGVAILADGNTRATVAKNTLTNNALPPTIENNGGVLAINLSMTVSVGELCLTLVENTSTTGYTLYNTTSSPTAINLEEGYQTNTGFINIAPTSLQPLPPAGPINIVPKGFCQN
ncbi:MAG: inverse autotransporter beta domain-containing protein [Verrucomicrobia bacterium]|nr:inverse autotransporter beta domain-containing protein [Verrucomicrobiota bacterium]